MTNRPFDWMKKIKSFFQYLVIIVVTLLLAEKVFDLLMSYVGKRLYWMDSCVVNDVWMLTLLLSVSVLIVFQQLKTSIEVYKDYRRNAWVIVIALNYGYACVFHRDSFTLFASLRLLAYADILMVWLALWFFAPLIIFFINKIRKSKAPKGETKKPSKLVGDDACPVDQLGRRTEAAAICEYIFDESNDFSTTMAISITGSWGEGKTVLMSYLKDCLKAKEISCFDYSPWQRSQKDVALDFLNHLNHHINGEHHEFKGMKAYIHSLKVSNVTGWFNMIVHVLRNLILGEEKSTSELLETARNEMMALEKPVVAFVDDVDRISRADFLDVMRLIRATANFPKLIYVVAYDSERAVKLLGKNYGEGYLSKIFNVSHPLSSIGDEKLHELALERFKEYGIDDEKKSPFAFIDLTEYLPTIRELKRFFNLLGKDYNAQSKMREKTYFDFDFYVGLELLKHIDLLAYKMLKYEPMAYLRVENKDWNGVACYKTKGGLDFQNEATENLLKYLFDQDVGDLNPFVCPGGLQIMFMDDLDEDYVSKLEFEKAIQEDNLVDSVKQWSEQHKEGIMFCLSKNLYIPTETILQVFELLIKNRPSDLLHDIDLRYHELYDNSSLDAFSRIGDVSDPYKYVEEDHSYYLYLSKSFYEGEKQELQEINRLKKNVSKTKNPKEYLAIICGLMRQSSENGETPESWVFDLAKRLFNSMASKASANDLKSQYDVVEAMHYLPYYDSTSYLLLPYLKKDPGFWLRLTLNVDSDITIPERMVVNTKVMHSMFDTYDKYQDVMAILKRQFAKNTKEYEMVKEHLWLTERTKSITTYDATWFEVTYFPTLKEIHYREQTKGIFVSNYYEDTKEMVRSGKCEFFAS